ncbi:hypothetical protein Pelo_19487 [Pelomyxa schiedti]|nr:hypothetical protein Pelo_19487 [Pelomyxa schiedti]
MLEGAESLVSSLSPKTYHAQHSISRGSSRPPARTLAYPYPSVHPLPSQQPAYWPDTGPVMPPQLPYISTPSTNGLTQSDNITNADQCKTTDQHFPTYSSQNPRFSDPGCGGYVPSISTTPYDQTCGAQPNLSPHGNATSNHSPRSTFHNYQCNH